MLSPNPNLQTPPPPTPHQHQNNNSLINTTIAPSSAATSLSSLTTTSGLSSINTDDLSQADSSSTSSASRYNSANLSSTQRKAIKNDIHSIVTLLTHNKSHAAQQYMLHTLLKHHTIKPIFEKLDYVTSDDMSTIVEQHNNYMRLRSSCVKKHPTISQSINIANTLTCALVDTPDNIEANVATPPIQTLASQHTSTLSQNDTAVLNNIAQTSNIKPSAARKILHKAKKVRHKIKHQSNFDINNMKNRQNYNTIQKQLKSDVQNWVLQHPNVKPSCISNDVLTVVNPTTNEKEKKHKMLMEVPVRDLHNDLIKPEDEGGLPGIINPNTGKPYISDTMLLSFMPQHVKK
jgi:hypothetical protein